MPRELTPEETKELLNRKPVEPIAPIPAPVAVKEGKAEAAETDGAPGAGAVVAEAAETDGAPAKKRGRKKKVADVVHDEVPEAEWAAAAARLDMVAGNAEAAETDGAPRAEAAGTDGAPGKGEAAGTAGAPGGMPRIVGGRLFVKVMAKRFLGVLQGLKPATGSSLPVLGCVRLTAVDGGGQLRCEVSNLDVWAEVSVGLDDGDVVGGAVLVSLKRLAELVRLAEVDEVWLEAGEGVLRVRCGDWEGRLLTLDPAEFPSWGDADLVCDVVEVEEGVLGRMLGMAVMAVSGDATRYVLNGVHVRGVAGGGLRAEGTDGRRLVRVDVVDVGAGDLDVIVPTASVRLLLGLLGAGKVRVQIGCREKWVEWACGGWRVRGKMIEGKFPDTDRVWPLAGGCAMSMDREGLVEMVERAGVMAERAENHAVAIEVSRAGLVTIRAVCPEVGQWKETRGLCAADQGPERMVQFAANAEFLSVLAGPRCEQVRLEVEMAGSSPQVKGALLWQGQEKDMAWACVLMPLNREEGN